MELILILHNIRSALNVGSIFRTADAAGVERIFLCGITPTPKNLPNKELGIKNKDSLSHNSKFIIHNSQIGAAAKIAKVALGAERNIPWEHVSQTWRVLEQFKKEKYQIVALEQSESSIDYRKFKPPPAGGPLALIVGNELTGLSSQLLKYCDTVVEIPMRGKKESLNVAVAAGIALYKIIE